MAFNSDRGFDSESAPPIGLENLSIGGLRFWHFSPHTDATLLASWANESAVGKRRPVPGVDVGDRILFVSDFRAFWERYRLELAVDVLGEEGVYRIVSEFFEK